MFSYCQETLNKISLKTQLNNLKKKEIDSPSLRDYLSEGSDKPEVVIFHNLTVIVAILIY
jgi:hypothetical protein